MAFDKWSMRYFAFTCILLVSSIGKVEAQSCGGTFTANSGVFVSPNYPSAYGINKNCTYDISLSIVSSITLSFETFELDRSSEDYVSINCVSNSSYVETKYYWNTNIPPVSIPSCSYGRLHFHSDNIQNYTTRGFKVQYHVSTKNCGNTVFAATSGTISSPNYPQNYNNDENCTYSIWASTTSSFTLTFQAFKLESDCQRDWVQISCDNSSYILPKYCGSTLPKPAYIGNCNKVLIWFHTDDLSVFSGFSLQYSVTSDGCGRTSHAGLSGIITSPNFPYKYSNISCAYYLYSVSSAALSFQSFDLEPFIDSALGDYASIECYSNISHGYNKFRGNALPPLISYSLCSHIRIYFYANNALFGPGFSVRYQINPLVAHSAIINTPKNFTVDVGSRVDLDCTSNAEGYLPSWTLSSDGTDENTTVIVSFCVINSGYTSQYSVVKGGLGVCNLVILSATLTHAGVYTCIDVGLASITSVVMVQNLTGTAYTTDQCNQDDVIIGLLVTLLVFGIIIIGMGIYIGDLRRKELKQKEVKPSIDSVKSQATSIDSEKSETDGNAYVIDMSTILF